jgi:hypothetical protein
MKQLPKLDKLISKMIKEEFGKISELSPELRYKAFDKARDAFDKSDDDATKTKRMSQAHTFVKNISPDVKNEADRVAKLIDKNFIASIEKGDRGKPDGMDAQIIFHTPRDPKSKKIKYYISKEKSFRVDVEPDQEFGPLPENAQRALERLIRTIREKELPKLDGEKKTLPIKEEKNPDLKKAIEAAKRISQEKGIVTHVVKSQKGKDSPFGDYTVTNKPDPNGSLVTFKAGNRVDEEDKEVVTTDGTSKTATSQQKQSISKAKAGDTIKYRKSGTIPSTSSLEEADELEPTTEEDAVQSPKATDLSGQVSEILDKLNAISEAPRDNKYKKHADKAIKYMEAAKTALEGLTAHEVMLEEKEKAVQMKDGESNLKNIRKHLGKVIKDKDSIEKIMKKMPIEKVLQLKDKSAGEIDEEKIAKAMLNVALREGFTK